MERVVKFEPIRCSECVFEGLQARIVAGVSVTSAGTWWASTRRKSRHRGEYEYEMLGYALGYPGDPRKRLTGGGELIEQILDPGETAILRCGRHHGGRPGEIVVDDRAVESALRRAGFVPASLRRVGSADPDEVPDALGNYPPKPRSRPPLPEESG
jgi:hypothetical protein